MLAPLDHIILFTLLFVIFFFIPREKQSYIDTHFWKALLIPIIAYTLLVGFRYGWGVDYIRYAEDYESRQFDKGYDNGFSIIESVLYSLGLRKFWMADMVFSLFFIISFFLIIKNIKGSSKYMLMLFLPATLMLNTYAIRQYVAVSFILIGYYFVSRDYSKKIYRYLKYVFASLLIYVAFTVHGASLVFSIPLFLAYFLRFLKPIKSTIAIAIYISVIIFSNFFIDTISNLFGRYIDAIFVTEHLGGYVENYSNILANAQVEMLGHSGLFLYFEYLSRIILIVLSGWALRYKPNNQVAMFYNMVIFGLCFQQLLFTSEIGRRIIDTIFMLYCIPVGYALYQLYQKYSTTQKDTNTFYKILSIILLLYIYYPFLKFILFFNLAGFIWN